MPVSTDPNPMLGSALGRHWLIHQVNLSRKMNAFSKLRESKSTRFYKVLVKVGVRKNTISSFSPKRETAPRGAAMH